MNELIDSAKALLDDAQKLREGVDIAAQQVVLQKLEAEMQQPDFWQDNERAQKISREASDISTEIASWEKLTTDIESVIELAEMSQADNDTSLQVELEQKLQQAQEDYRASELRVLLSGEFDASDVIVSIHAGAGGADAQDWAEMLLRMMLRYAERKGFATQLVDESRGTEAGIKSATFTMRGRYAYGYSKSEHGVHRLVRQSPFNADALRQTSFAKIEVLPDLGELSPIEIKDEDIRIDVFRAGGNGGQSVNTTDSAVRIVHLATGITVSCQNEKSQHQNKAAAMQILKARLHQLQIEEQQAQQAELRGAVQSAEWGNQIRSYVLHPYKMVKDHRTEYEESDPDAVLDGKLESFVEAYLRATI